MPYCAADITVLVTGVVESVKNRTLERIFIVASTTIGAGMLQRNATAGSSWRWFQRHAGVVDWPPAGADVLYRCAARVYPARSGGYRAGLVGKRYLEYYGQWPRVPCAECS